jgi:transposase
MIVADARRVLTLKHEIEALDETVEPPAHDCEMARRIDTIPGFGITSSAELAGEIGTLARFAGEASLALYLGMATLDDSSGKQRGSKPPRQINTRAKAAMMIAAMHHIEQVSASRAYYDKKRAQGKTHNQAVRCLAMRSCVWIDSPPLVLSGLFPFCPWFLLSIRC